MRSALILIAVSLLPVAPALAQDAYTVTLVDIPGGTFTQGEPESEYEGRPGTWDAPEVSVTLSDFRMSETEVTNAQYVSFLNSAEANGLVEVGVETAMGPDAGFTLVYGTSAAPAEYAGIAIINLSGTRVMKDHDNGDGDDNPFTGVIEPENPLNISYVGYRETAAVGSRFYVKDPRDSSDFDWQTLTNYYNYSTAERQLDTSVQLNDYDAWAELDDYPNNLPTQADVANWPASFVRWYGAKAFALYYDEYDLPTEAEWEYAGYGGADFSYATADGMVVGDGTSAIWNWIHPSVATGHVLDAKWGSPNPYGLYNMAGNIWEWVEDWYNAAFYADGTTDPVNTTAAAKKVRRGGSWNYHKAMLKTAARGSDEQFKGNDHFGFRVVSRVTDLATEPGDVPKETALEVYPNPSSHLATVRLSAAHGSQRLEVIDLLGRVVMTKTAQGQVTLDVSGLPAGVYGVRVAGQVRTLIISR